MQLIEHACVGNSRLRNEWVGYEMSSYARAHWHDWILDKRWAHPSRGLLILEEIH